MIDEAEDKLNEANAASQELTYKLQEMQAIQKEDTLVFQMNEREMNEEIVKLKRSKEKANSRAEQSILKMKA